MPSSSRWTISPSDVEPPRSLTDLADQIEKDGGSALALYREPVGDAWQIFAILPLASVEPTPYQRNLSKPHVERLRDVIQKLDRFIDPVVAVRTPEGEYWTPNGNHRLAALKKIKAKFIPVVLIPDPAVAFQILALNTEKAHNLKDKSLEVIRMYKALSAETGSKTEQDFAFQFEEAYYITLGIIYERKPRFAGGAFSPILRRVDTFFKEPLRKAVSERERRADEVERADVLLSDAAARLKKRGIFHPYIKNFVLARVNPLSRARKTLPSFEVTFEKLTAALAAFDISGVRYEDVTRAAGRAAPP